MEKRKGEKMRYGKEKSWMEKEFSRLELLRYGFGKRQQAWKGI